MTSEARTAANIRNSRRSTGPRTVEGKRTASKNATRHGIFATEATLPDEDRETFFARLQALTEDLRPVGALEEELVDRVGLCLWRLRRVARAESAVLVQHMLNMDVDDARADAEREKNRLLGTEYIPTPPDMAERIDAARALARNDRGARLARSLTRDVSGPRVLELLAKYERAAERALYAALEELRLRQEMRLTMEDPGDVDAVDGVVAGEAEREVARNATAVADRDEPSVEVSPERTQRRALRDPGSLAANAEPSLFPDGVAGSDAEFDARSSGDATSETGKTNPMPRCNGDGATTEGV